MKTRRSLQDLIQEAGINPSQARQPTLPAPIQPAVVASEEDHYLARSILVEQRRNGPAYKDPSKQLKRIFRTSKEKEKLQDTAKWEFSQDEIDQALTAVIDQPTTSPGLIQAFLGLGAKVNFIEPAKGAKQLSVSARRRSTVLQRAATTRRSDAVSLLAGSGADQTTLDDSLRAALTSNDHSSVQELLRHGADINKIPQALADAVRSNDENLVRLLLRAPKAVRPDIVSSCLPAAVQQKTDIILLLLVGNGADPNFDNASALKMTVSSRQYRSAVALAAGSIRLTVPSLQSALDLTLRMGSLQEIQQFLQLLFACGLPPDSLGLPELLANAAKRNDTTLAHMLIHNGVSTGFNDAQSLKSAIGNSSWAMTDAILATSISPAQASASLAMIPTNAPRHDRLRVIGGLIQKGARGPALGQWLARAVDEGDSQLMSLLVNHGVADDANTGALHAAIARKDLRSLNTLLKGRPSAQSLASLFPLLRKDYSKAERLEATRLLLEHGARGIEIDQALVDAVADTTVSRDSRLIGTLAKYADINFGHGKAVCLATSQADVAVLQLLCACKPSAHTTSTALHLAFDSNGNRRAETLPMIGLLLGAGVQEEPAVRAMQKAVNGGPQNLDIIDRLIEAKATLVSPAFETAASLGNSAAKLQILTRLLSVGVTQKSLDVALSTEVHQCTYHSDSSIARLLLHHGASADYNNGEVLGFAVTACSPELVRSLLGSHTKPARSSITRAFRNLFHDISVEDNTSRSNARIEIVGELLRAGVDQPVIDAALRTTLDTKPWAYGTDAIIDLLLQYQANVNTADGTCFMFAAQQADFGLFNKLLAHRPDFALIVPVLLASKLDEDDLLQTLRLCFEHGCSPDALEKSNYGVARLPVLISTMQEYPRGASLATFFLEHGCNPEVTTTYILDLESNEEVVSALMWALAQPQKMVSSSVILALLDAGASATRAAPSSELTPIALAARQGRHDIVQELLSRGADASARDRWNRSPLFYASSTSAAASVETLSAHALKDDGSLHEAARCLQLEAVTILIKHGHKPNFPCRLHSGRNVLGELCLGAEVITGSQRTKLRQIIRILLDAGANPKFKARSSKSAVLLALDNPYSALPITEALLETDVWEDLNDEKHMYYDPQSGLWYSPLKYVELIPSHARQHNKAELHELLQDKGCEPRFYSETPDQPVGAIGLPPSIAHLADRAKDHQLSLRIAKESSEHARRLEEDEHRDILRRKQEQQDADMANAAAQQAHWQNLEQQKHEFEMQRVRSAERMKRSEKVAWHNLQLQQESDFAASRAQIEQRKADAAFAQEGRMAKQRQGELDYKAGVERAQLMEKEQLFERNVARQKALTDRVDESAQLHARLRQERPAIEPAQWGSVD